MIEGDVVAETIGESFEGVLCHRIVIIHRLVVIETVDIRCHSLIVGGETGVLSIRLHHTVHSAPLQDIVEGGQRGVVVEHRPYRLLCLSEAARLIGFGVTGQHQGSCKGQTAYECFISDDIHSWNFKKITIYEQGLVLIGVHRVLTQPRLAGDDIAVRYGEIETGLFLHLVGTGTTIVIFASYNIEEFLIVLHIASLIC